MSICPHCKVETTHGFSLGELRVLRCGRCSGVFSHEGARLEPELELAVAAMDEVKNGRDVPRTSAHFFRLFGPRREPYITGVSTASERAYWLRSTFASRGLATRSTLFDATRRQLAAAYGMTEPLVPKSATGYRDASQIGGQTWSGEAPKKGFFGSGLLEIRIDQICCGRASVPRSEALFFRIEAELRENVVYELFCTYGRNRKSQRLTVVALDGLDRLRSLVIEMEDALGWLQTRP